MNVPVAEISGELWMFQSRYNTSKVIVADLINNDASKQFNFDIPLNKNLNYFKSFLSRRILIYLIKHKKNKLSKVK